MRQDVIADLVAKHIPENAYAEQWDAAGLKEGIRADLNLDLPIEEWVKEEGIAEEEIKERITQAADAAATDRAGRFGPEVMTYVERSIMLQTLDHLWREHLVNLDHLRSVVGFRGYAQRDPLNEYKSEAFELFQTMLGNLRQAVTAQLMRVELVREAAEAPPPQAPETFGHHVDGTTGEDDFAEGLRRRFGFGARRQPHRRGRAARPQQPDHMGQGRPQRALPLRFGQEIQALPRRFRLRRFKDGPA